MTRIDDYVDNIGYNVRIHAISTNWCFGLEIRPTCLMYAAGNFEFSNDNKQLISGTVNQLAKFDGTYWSQIVTLSVKTICMTSLAQGLTHLYDGEKIWEIRDAGTKTDKTPSNMRGNPISMTFAGGIIVLFNDKTCGMIVDPVAPSNQCSMRTFTLENMTGTAKQIVSNGYDQIKIMTTTNVYNYKPSDDHQFTGTTTPTYVDEYRISGQTLLGMQPGELFVSDGNIFTRFGAGGNLGNITIPLQLMIINNVCMWLYDGTHLYMIQYTNLADILTRTSKIVIYQSENKISPSVINTPLPAVINTPLPAVVNTPLPAVVNTPLPAVINTPLPAVVNTPLPAVINTPLPAVVSVATDPIDAQTIVDNEYARLTKKQDSIDTLIKGQERVAGLNANYAQRIAQYRNIIIVSIVTIILLFGVRMLSQIAVSEQYITVQTVTITLLYIIIGATSIITIIQTFINIQSRDNMDFNLLTLNPPTIDTSNNSTAGTANYTNLTGLSTCIGAACCDAEHTTEWDDVNQKCVAAFTTLEQAYLTGDIIPPMQQYTGDIKSLYSSSSYSLF